MPYPLSHCCDEAPIADESSICAGCKEHTDFYYPKETYWTDNYSFCDHCGRQGYVKQETEVTYDDEGEVESEEPITSLCVECANK